MSKKLIDLREYKSNSIDLQRFRSELYKRIGQEMFVIYDWEKLATSSLKEISFKSKASTSRSNLDNKALIVLNHFYRLRFKKEITKPILEYYVTDILGFYKMPSLIFQELESRVKIDLNKVNRLIHWYESFPFLKKYLDKNIPLHGHEEWMHFDFYKRCLKEQSAILNYLLNGIKVRVIEKARWPSLVKIHILFFEEELDYPYQFHKENALSHFDYGQINESAHRIEWAYLDECSELNELYKKNKQQFYKKFFLKNPLEAIFKNIHFYYHYLPFKNDRTPILKELERLFKTKKWMAFYALALPQVEGLFTEILDVCFSQNNRNSLPEKVNKLRPHYKSSINYFDYFQYKVPILRNKFMHTGFGDEFKLKANDLLSDINFLLKMFYELENPIVKIKKLHTQKNPQDFLHYSSFGLYFSQLDQLSDSQKTQLNEKIMDFEKQFLFVNCNIDYTIMDFINTLPSTISNFLLNIELNTKFTKDDVNLLKTRNRNQITELSKNEEFKEFIESYNEIEIFEDYDRFLSGYKRYLPSLKTEYLTQLDKLKKSHGFFIKNILELKNIIQIKQQI